MARSREDVVTSEPIVAALSTEVQLWLTVAYIVLYGLLFVIVFVQLWMIYRFKHRLLSYQTTFLFLSLFWTALRIELFSFYFQNSELANQLPFIFYWLLYCCPICIQFVTLCLLVIFFAQVILRTSGGCSIIAFRSLLFGLIGTAVTIFLVTNVTCAKLAHDYSSRSSAVPHSIPIVRVAINDTLFLLMGAALSVCIYRVSQLSSVSVVLEAKGTTKCQAVTASLLIVLLYTSRAVYSLIAVINGHLFGFGYGWINVTDQADFVSLHQSMAYVSFGIVLFVWEFLPTLAIVLFYRVRVPFPSHQAGIMTDVSPTRSDFFANPRRYDSDDELDHETSVQNHSWSSFLGSSPHVVRTFSNSFLDHSPRHSPRDSTHYGTFLHGVSPLARGFVAGSISSQIGAHRPVSNFVSSPEHHRIHQTSEPVYNGT